MIRVLNNDRLSCIFVPHAKNVIDIAVADLLTLETCIGFKNIELLQRIIDRVVLVHFKMLMKSGHLYPPFRGYSLSLLL